MTLASVRNRGSASSTGWNIRKPVIGAALAHAGSASEPSIVGASGAADAGMTFWVDTPGGATAVVAARAPESPDCDGSCALAAEPKPTTSASPAVIAGRDPL